MKELMKALCILAVILGAAFGALLLLKQYAGHHYLTVEED